MEGYIIITVNLKSEWNPLKMARLKLKTLAQK